MSSRKKSSHGGKRAGCGRPKELDKWEKILVVLEDRHLRKLEAYVREHKLRSRSEAVRFILDTFFHIRRKRGKR
jgi:hypothetical protein